LTRAALGGFGRSAAAAATLTHALHFNG